LEKRGAADALSRQMQCDTITTIQCKAWEGLEAEVQTDAKLKNIVEDLISDPLSHLGYQLKGGRLFHEGRVVIPKQSPRIAWKYSCWWAFRISRNLQKKFQSWFIGKG
jgi:hypothetical protein